MAKFLPFSLPDIGEEEIKEVVDTLRSMWLTTGPKAATFERDFADHIGSNYALAVSSGTAGLHLALEASGIGEGDLVITSPYTFTATAGVVGYLGADPVFVDIDPNTYLIDPEQIREFCLTECTAQDGRLFHRRLRRFVSGIVPVHIAGSPCDLDAIEELADSYDLAVVEDATHALPSTYKGRRIGSGPNPAAFSFYATKPLTIGEGGMVTTNDEIKFKRMEVMRLHGISHDVWDRYQATTPKWFYEVVAPGFKYNMPDVMAAIGIHQLKKVDRFHQRRRFIAQHYSEAFEDLDVITCPRELPDTTHSWHLYIIQINNSSMERDWFIEELARRGIGASVHYIPLHIHPYYRERYGFKPDDFPKALQVFRKSVSLPIHTKMADSDIERVVDAVRAICEKTSK